MRRRRLQVQLTERQQLILALLLIIVVAISMLYCLGLASLVLRQTWRDTTLPWNGANPTAENLNMTPTVPPVQSPPPATTAP